MSTLDPSRRSAFSWREWDLAARIGLWLLVLPIQLYRTTLPGLLQRVSRSAGCPSQADLLPVARTARIVRRVARMRLFDLPLFPRICLRQSLALYWVLRRHGYPCEFHLGARKRGGEFQAHSWVSLSGQVLMEDNEEYRYYRRLYTYPLRTKTGGEAP